MTKPKEKRLDPVFRNEKFPPVRREFFYAALRYFVKSKAVIVIGAAVSETDIACPQRPSFKKAVKKVFRLFIAIAVVNIVFCGRLQHSRFQRNDHFAQPFAVQSVN